MTPFWVGLAGGGAAAVGLFVHLHLRRPQAQRISDNGQRTQAHRRRGDNGAQQQPEDGVERRSIPCPADSSALSIGHASNGFASLEQISISLVNACDIVLSARIFPSSRSFFSIATR